MIQRRTIRGIVVLGVLAALSFWLNRDTTEQRPTGISGLDTRLNYALRDFEARYFDEQGQLAGHITAPLLTNEAETGIGRIDQPRVRVVHEGNLWTILSDSATLTPDRQRVVLTGAVNMTGREAGTLREVEIQSSNVTVEIDPRIARSDEAVTIQQDQDFLAATGFMLDMTSNNFHLDKSVRGHYVLP